MYEKNRSLAVAIPATVAPATVTLANTLAKGGLTPPTTDRCEVNRQRCLGRCWLEDGQRVQGERCLVACWQSGHNCQQGMDLN